jgi:hypothetical protein
VAFFQMTATTFTPSSPIAAQIDPSDPPNLLLYCDEMNDPAQLPRRLRPPRR